MSFLDRFSSRKGKKNRGKSAGKSAGKSSSRRSRRNGSSLLTAVLALVAVAALGGTGLLKWTESQRGQAALLTLGAEKVYAEVQTAVESALLRELPDLEPGPATLPQDHDWPAPTLGPGAMIRCRSVAVQTDETWWEIQARLAATVRTAGAQVLWGERLVPERLGPEQLKPNEERDLLRLDFGVAGRPTHTLVLHRAGVKAAVQWGRGPGLTRWAEFSGDMAPTVALVIDDWGQAKTKSATAILDLPVPLTMAVLPDLPFSRYFSLQATPLVLPPALQPAGQPASASGSRQARLAVGCPVEVSTGRVEGTVSPRRREVILHLPMQPDDYPQTNPGQNPILVGMQPAEIRRRVEKALDSLAGATGLNNHMGSAATGDTPTMRALMDVLKDKDLVFVDSLTSSRSVAYAEAVRAGIPAARNRIFLDYDNENESTIKANLERLVQSARSSGLVLGIGHPHPATAAVLQREIPRLMREGVRFVTVSELLALQQQRAAAVADPKGS